MAPWLGIVLVLSTLAAMFGALKLIKRVLHPHPELLRKFVHVGTGLVVVSFPWIFARPWPVLLLAAVTGFALVAVKRIPVLRNGIGSVITGVNRRSFGETLFPVAVAALILLSRGDKLLFVVPMLIMTLADTVAALVGLAYGKVRYLTSDGFKSAEGSIAFFTIAFLSIHAPLLLFRPDVGRLQTLLIAVIIGLLSMLIEAISARGVDNLLIPLGAFAFLRLYLHATPDALLLRLAATVILLIFALSWRRRSTLDDSALMACALFGYGVYMLGGPVWMIGPTLLFLIHAGVWPRFGTQREHSVYAVASVAFVALIWLGLEVAYGDGSRFLFPYAVGFGAHLAIIGVSRIAVEPSSTQPSFRLIPSIFAGSGLMFAQMLPVLLHRTPTAFTAKAAFVFTVGPGCIAVSAVAFFLLLPRLYGERGSDAKIHLTAFAGALAGSLLAAAACLVCR